MRSRCLVLSFSTFLLATSLGFADIVKLKNGETLEGVVTSKENNYVTIEMPCGEMGFDMSLVDSIDTAGGPRTKDDLTTLRDASRKRAADQDSQREMATARRDAAVAADAAARRESAPVADAAVDTGDAAVNSAADRIAAYEEALGQIVSRREREKVRRELLNFFFGPGYYDPILKVGR